MEGFGGLDSSPSLLPVETAENRLEETRESSVYEVSEQVTENMGCDPEYGQVWS